MFIVNSGTISNLKEYNIINDNTPTLQFRFVGDTFLSNDVFQLTANATANNNYSFIEDGIIKFQDVNLGELASGENDINIVITKNGNNILQDIITVNNPNGGGSGSSDYELPLKTEKIQLFSGKENSQYYLSATKYSKYQDNYTLQSGETG